jgi:hypothetical protein
MGRGGSIPQCLSVRTWVRPVPPGPVRALGLVSPFRIGLEQFRDVYAHLLAEEVPISGGTWQNPSGSTSAPSVPPLELALWRAWFIWQQRVCCDCCAHAIIGVPSCVWSSMRLDQ